MDSRERVLRAIRHEPVDRVPYYYMGTKQVNRAVAQRLDLAADDEVAVGMALGGDLAYLRPIFVPGPDRREFQYGDVHAKVQQTKGHESVVVAKRPLEDVRTVEDVLHYPLWPHPDNYEYRIPQATLDLCRDRALVGYDMGIIFLYAMGMRGMEQICVDMASAPEIARAVFGKIADYNWERTRRYLEANPGVLDIIGIGDDVAGQAGMLMSPRMWRAFIRPHVQRMVDLCRDFGVTPYFHGCGGFRALYNDFIEMGIPNTGRLQTEAKGNNLAEIKAEYGARLCLWGAIDGQHACVEGTPSQVRAHVRQVLATGGPTGFIAGPTHSFTEDTPIENILAVYEVLRQQ